MDGICASWLTVSSRCCSLSGSYFHDLVVVGPTIYRRSPPLSPDRVTVYGFVSLFLTIELIRGFECSQKDRHAFPGFVKPTVFGAFTLIDPNIIRGVGIQEICMM